MAEGEGDLEVTTTSRHRLRSGDKKSRSLHSFMHNKQELPVEEPIMAQPAEPVVNTAPVINTPAPPVINTPEPPVATVEEPVAPPVESP